MNNQNVRPVESGFVMTHAFRQCRRKILKKGGYSNDKLSVDEKDQFTNCLSKYIDLSNYSSEGLRAGLIDTLQ